MTAAAPPLERSSRRIGPLVPLRREPLRAPIGRRLLGWTKALAGLFLAAVAPEASELPPRVVEAARCGDHRAFRWIVDHYDNRLRALAYRLLEDRDAMDDALQEAYLKAFRSIGSFRGESSLGTWLHRITYNVCMDQLRRRKDTFLLFDPDRDDEPAPSERARPGSAAQDPLDAAVTRTDLAAALATLSAEGRAAVQLVDAEGWTYEEAAKVLGVSPGTLASRVSRARTALRRAMGTSS